MDWVLREPPPIETSLRAAIRDWHHLDETKANARIAAAELPPEARDRIGIAARRFAAAVRRKRIGGGLGAFLHEYALFSQEGDALMCLAEALLRIPDAETVDKLIRDKIAAADWQRHLGYSGSLFVNALTWTLMLTGRLLRRDCIGPGKSDLGEVLRRLSRGRASLCGGRP